MQPVLWLNLLHCDAEIVLIKYFMFLCPTTIVLYAEIILEDMVEHWHLSQQEASLNIDHLINIEICSNLLQNIIH